MKRVRKRGRVGDRGGRERKRGKRGGDREGQARKRGRRGGEGGRRTVKDERE